MVFQPIRRIIPQAIHRNGLSQPITAARVLQEAQSAIERVWGSERAAYVTPVSFQSGILKLLARAPSAVQELKLAEIRLQNEINRTLGERKVARLAIVDRL